MDEPSKVDSVENKIVRCEIHGLRYPADGSGCVLCRRAQTAEAAPTSAASGLSGRTKLLIAVVAAAAVAGYFMQFRRGPSVRYGGSIEAADNPRYVECIEDCAQLTESCDAKCRADGAAGRCRPGCLNGYIECGEKCSLKQNGRPDPVASAYYVGPMPMWDEIIERIEPASSDLAKCDAKRVPTFVRVSLKPDGGWPQDVVVASPAADADLERCIGERLARVPFPGAAKAYSFVTKLDLKTDLTDLALRSAEARLEDAQANHHADVSAAQQRVWMLREQLRASQTKKREEAQRAAEEGAREHETESYHGTYYHSPSSPESYDRSPGPTRKTWPGDSEGANARDARDRIEEAQRDADRMRRERINDERRLREQRSEDVREAEERSRMEQLQQW